MAAVRHSPIAIRHSLVRLGKLSFDDFLLLTPQTLDFGLWTSDLASDWAVALNNAPRVEFHLRAVDCKLQTANCKLAADLPSLADVLAAQQRLVAHYAYDLLRAKAPPLYDALPWQDWDFSIVTRRFPLWKTRFLLTGDGTTVTMCRCRKSAGVYALEPNLTIARYIERKAAVEKVRRFRLLPLDPSFPRSLGPLPPVDLAILGSSPELATRNSQLVTTELLRVAANVLIVECSPLVPPFDQSWLCDNGFVSETVEVRGLGPRPCHWKLRSDGPRNRHRPGPV